MEHCNGGNPRYRVSDNFWERVITRVIFQTRFFKRKKEDEREREREEVEKDKAIFGATGGPGTCNGALSYRPILNKEEEEEEVERATILRPRDLCRVTV